MPLLAHRLRSSVVVAYIAFVLTGISASVGAVVVPAQMADYDITRKAIGLTFFTFSAGFFLAGASTGWLMSRLGTRLALLVGSGTYIVGALATAARPSFVLLVAVQFLAGYGTGIIESVLNAYLAELPRGASRLNLLHAFFGVGALIGPIAASWLIARTEWTVIWLLLALLSVPIAVAYAFTAPGRTAVPPDEVVEPVPLGAPTALAEEAVLTGAAAASPGPGAETAVAAEVGPAAGRSPERGLLAAALRDRGVMLAAVFLTVYVGVEMSVGTWGVNYLTDHRELAVGLAGASLSGYWLGLTVGRFVISPASEALGWSLGRMTTICLAGVAACGLLVAVAPGDPVAVAGLALLGFFLAPLFPTAIAVVPRLTEQRLVPTAVGLLNAVSVVGGSALPWLAGALGDGVGIWTLLPYVTALALVQLVIWRLVVARMRR